MTASPMDTNAALSGRTAAETATAMATTTLSGAPLAAVLLDVDGVLLDSTAVHRAVWSSWSALHGLNPARVWPLTFGRRPADTVCEAAPHLDPLAERAVLDGLLAARAGAVGPVAGAAAFLGGLPAGRWALVTSGDRTTVHTHFTRLGLPLPGVQVYGADVAHGKPAPDCFLLAARGLGVEPGRCLVVEDAPGGVRAARAAGCEVVGLTTTHPAAALGEAHHVLPGLAEAARLTRARLSR
ncbi:HAD-IA family hydrolase [Streptomyces sp. NPDC049954]|uniref:HAD family hydrolase n=1 Tax=Streptomyces sp. NPDC049954 TaxID=3155779 RepID=UPI0034276715